MTDEVRIPTHAEHRRLLRRIWISCAAGGILIGLFSGGVCVVLYLRGWEPKRIVEVTTAVFQSVVLGYGGGFVLPCLLTTAIGMHMGILMSRKALELTDKTGRKLDELPDKVRTHIKEIEAKVDVWMDRAETKMDRLIERIEKKAIDDTIDHL